MCDDHGCRLNYVRGKLLKFLPLAQGVRYANSRQLLFSAKFEKETRFSTSIRQHHSVERVLFFPGIIGGRNFFMSLSLLRETTKLLLQYRQMFSAV